MGHIEQKKIKLKSGEIAVFRCPHPADAAELLAHAKTVLSETLFTLTEADEFDKTIEQEAKWIQDHAENSTQIAIICELDGRIVAHLDFATGLRRRIAHHGEFGMGVLKEYWGKGIGAELLKLLLDWAAANPKIEKVNLRVYATNTRAIALYNKLGFEQEGHFKRYAKYSDGQYADGLAMAKFVK